MPVCCFRGSHPVDRCLPSPLVQPVGYDPIHEIQCLHHHTAQHYYSRGIIRLPQECIRDAVLQDLENTLHPLLCPWRKYTALWDVDRSPNSAHQITYRGRSDPVPAHSLVSPATYPPIRQMRISFDGFPWKTTVYNDDGVSVGDVLQAAHDKLQEPLNEEEWLAKKSARRAKIHHAMLRRIAAGPPSRKSVTLKIDCLADRTFKGLEPAGTCGDEWALKLGPS